MKTAIITGAYGVIGHEIAKGLVEAQYHTILVGRDEKKLKLLYQELNNYINRSELEYYALDLSRKAHILKLAKSIDIPIDVLVNNAATAPRSRTLNEDGLEMQWATNVLGYYWMIKAFTAHLERADNGRVVNVASYWAGGLDMDDPEFTNRPYNNDDAYRQSKQADRMLTYGYALHTGNAFTVNVCHSGDANSKLSNDLGFGGSISARQAAKTPLFLATDPEMVNISGSYFTDCQEAHCPFKSDKSEIVRLMELCSTY